MTDPYITRLQEVNKRLNLTNIRGKEYAEVNQRILGFWELFPDGRIITYWHELEEARATCQAFVFKNGKHAEKALSCLGFAEGGASALLILTLCADATGTAYEVKTSGGVNSTSYIENAETSAVGRALGMLGIGATNAIASAEEVRNAINQQESNQSGSKPIKKPVKAKGDKAPAQDAKTPDNGSQSVADAIDAQRRRLVDACSALSLATGQDKSEIMRAAAAQLKEKTEEEYRRVAATIEKMARDAGVKYEGD